MEYLCREGLSYVYCVGVVGVFGETKAVKIGFSYIPGQRLNSIQLSNHERIKILAMIPCPEKLARDLRDDLQNLCWERRKDSSGKWFHPHSDVLETVRRVAELFGNLSDNQKNLVMKRFSWLSSYARGQENEIPDWLRETPEVAATQVKYVSWDFNAIENLI